MKRLLLGAALAATCTTAMAQSIGVSIARFDDNFLTSMRQAMEAEAEAQGYDIQFLDAQEDIGRQLSQVQSLAAQGVDAIIINPVDTAATSRMTGEAVLQNIPLVYVNREPEGDDLDNDGVVFVGSEQKRAGTLQMEALARCLVAKVTLPSCWGTLHLELHINVPTASRKSLPSIRVLRSSQNNPQIISALKPSIL